MERYILNARSGMVHDREGLTERCNTDDLKRRHDLSREELDLVREARVLRYCSLCMPDGLDGGGAS
jgi:hypothetical protein